MDRVDETVNIVVKPFFKGDINDSSMIGMDDDKVYRITGKEQINDMIECGYVRSRENGTHGNRVFWTQGCAGYAFAPGDKYTIVVSASNLKNKQIGAVPLSEVTNVFKYNMEENRFVDVIEVICGLNRENSVKNSTTSSIINGKAGVEGIDNMECLNLSEDGGLTL